MKTIVIMLLAQFTFGQIENLGGVWEHQEGNEIFRVTFAVFDSCIGDIYGGHYEKVSVDSNGNETLIYTSNKMAFPGSDILLPPALELYPRGRVGYQNGRVYDVVDDDNRESGIFHLTEVDICSTCPRQIKMRLTCYGIPDECFTIPHDVVLTKQ